MDKRLSVVAAAALSWVVVGSWQGRAQGEGAPPAAVAETKVTAAKVSISASLLDYRGACPVPIPLTGSITTSGPGRVRYQFVHSAGAQGAVQVLDAPRAGDYQVTETRTMDAQSPPWNDRVVLRILSSSAPLDSSELKYAGACQRVEAVARTATLTLGPARGRFRVTLNGFTCHQPTLDLATLGAGMDGADDEVYLFTKAFNLRINPDGWSVAVTGPDFRRTMEIGDTSRGRFPQRIRGGSSVTGGANGGFKAGDSFPDSPMKHSTSTQWQGLPLAVWEGVLERRSTAVVIVPTIWESDGGTSLLYGPWQQQGLESLHGVGRLIRNPQSTEDDQRGVKLGIQSEVMGQVRTERRAIAPSGDRPIGMFDQSAGTYMFQPKILILTYDEALRMVQQSQAKNGEAFPITYTNGPGLGGSYTIYVQVDQLPN